VKCLGTSEFGKFEDLMKVESRSPKSQFNLDR
jgi:hypothetical protein